MHPPSAGETSFPTSSVGSQPNAASAALQRIHGYIDSQLTDLVEAAVDSAVNASYNKLADLISTEIISIRKQAFQCSRDEDDSMSPPDQQHSNCADGDDESEENHRQHQQNRQTQRSNNRRKRQQMGDDDGDESDGTIHCRRKTPVILSVRNHFPSFHMILLKLA